MVGSDCILCSNTFTNCETCDGNACISCDETVSNSLLPSCDSDTCSEGYYIALGWCRACNY